MFTYTTLFLGSFILAVVAIFVFKVVSDTRKAAEKSRERVDLVERAPTHQYEGVARVAGAGAGPSPTPSVSTGVVSDYAENLSDNSMSWDSAKLTPAMADERAVVESHGSGTHFPEHPKPQAAGPQKSGGCSLYEITEAEPAVVNETGGRSYKVTHHGPFDSLED